MEKKNGKKLLAALLIIVVFLFALYNVAWAAWKLIGFDAYRSRFPAQETVDGVMRMVDKDGFIFTMHEPEYLSFSGELRVQLPDGSGALVFEVSLFSAEKSYCEYPDGQGGWVKLEERSDWAEVLSEDKTDALVLKAIELWGMRRLMS